MVEELLKTPIPDDLIQMNNLARKLDAYRYEAYAKMVQANKTLTETKNRFQMLKSPKNTAEDRKFYTELHTKDEQAALDMAQGEYKIINDKINLIQTLSKSETEMLKRS